MKTIQRYLFSMFPATIILLFLGQCDQVPQQNCSTYDTAKFVGNYNVSEFCQQGFGHGYTFATITPGNGTQNELDFVNFLNTGQTMKAYIDCDGSYFRIPQQNLGSSAFTVVGEGNYFDTGGFEQLQFDLQLNEFGQANFCQYTFSR